MPPLTLDTDLEFPKLLESMILSDNPLHIQASHMVRERERGQCMTQEVQT